MYVTKNFVMLANTNNPREFVGSLRDMDPDINVQFDTRNGIICIDPTYDLECIANYYDFLTSVNGDWISAGYLDLGLVPIFMQPSFMPDMENYLQDINSKLGAQCYVLRPVSFMRSSYLGPNDIWVKREDFRAYLSEILGQELTEEQAKPSLWLRALHASMPKQK